MSGIYAITNRVTGCRYVGSSVQIAARLRRHRRELDRDSHTNQYLQRAWNKYGALAFVFEVLEEIADRHLLIACEQRHLDTARPNVYNVAIVVAAPMLGRQWADGQHDKFAKKMRGHLVSEETRKKIGDANRGRSVSAEHREAIRESRLGTKASVETRAKMSAARLGKPLGPRSESVIEAMRARLVGRNLSLEHRAKIGAAHRGRKQSAEWIAKRTAHNFGNQYWRMRKAERIA